MCDSEPQSPSGQNGASVHDEYLVNGLHRLREGWLGKAAWQFHGASDNTKAQGKIGKAYCYLVLARCGMTSVKLEVGHFLRTELTHLSGLLDTARDLLKEAARLAGDLQDSPTRKAIETIGGKGEDANADKLDATIESLGPLVLRAGPGAAADSQSQDRHPSGERRTQFDSLRCRQAKARDISGVPLTSAPERDAVLADILFDLGLGLSRYLLQESRPPAIGEELCSLVNAHYERGAITVKRGLWMLFDKISDVVLQTVESPPSCVDERQADAEDESEAAVSSLADLLAKLHRGDLPHLPWAQSGAPNPAVRLALMFVVGHELGHNLLRHDPIDMLRSKERRLELEMDADDASFALVWNHLLSMIPDVRRERDTAGRLCDLDYSVSEAAAAIEMGLRCLEVGEWMSPGCERTHHTIDDRIAALRKKHPLPTVYYHRADSIAGRTQDILKRAWLKVKSDSC